MGLQEARSSGHAGSAAQRQSAVHLGHQRLQDDKSGWVKPPVVHLCLGERKEHMEEEGPEASKCLSEVASTRGFSLTWW